MSIQGSAFYPVDYWQGIHLNLPGGSGGELLRTNAGAPKPSAGNYIWVTGDGTTHVSCLGSIANGTGEGFLAITADGTRYWFNWMAQYMEPVLKATNGTGRIPRRKNVLYATRVEDRFGNRVDYTYTNAWNQPARLTRIQANDGRTLTLAYNGQGFISTVNDGVRTWTYTYSPSSLTGVELPDGSRWQIALAPLSSARIDLFKGIGLPAGEPWRTCVWQPEAVGQTVFTGSITHPSGATGQFTVEVERHGRTNVPVNCLNYTSPHNDVNDDISFWPITYDNFALKTKTITGPGLPPATWQYDYHSPPSYYYPSGSSSHPVCPVGTDCSIPRCTSDDCAGASRTTVIGPEGKWTRYWHGNSYRYNEGKLLSVETGAGPSSVLKRTTNSYDLNNTLRFGTSPQQRGDGFASEYVRPQLAAVVAQQGVDYTWQANAFDAFARPTSVTKSSTVAGNPSKTEVTAYHDHLAKWVVGQPSKLTVGGIVASETSYNADALPTVSKRFGKTVQTLTYHADGTVATVKDGNNNVTTLSGWKRGIPQAIKYPATPEAPTGATQSAVVNDQGWITRITDENGFATNYAYDPMGRLSRITYPTGDSTAWNATSFVFEQRAGSAYGLAGGHWRQVVSTGNGVKRTYFDALWRPVLVQEYDAGNVAATNRFTRYAYDHEGRTTFTSYPVSSISSLSAITQGTHTSYNALGRVTAVRKNSELGDLVTVYSYLSNADGYYTRITDPKGHQTRIWYQAFDQPSEDYPTILTYPGGRTDIARDVFGKPKSITRSGGGVSATRSYLYNVNQLLCKVVDPETRATILDYDGAGNLAWSRTGSGYTNVSSCNTGSIPVADRTVRTYDKRNRLKSVTYPDNLGNTTYSYTPDGLLAQVLADNGGTNQVYNNYVYNKRRLLTGESMSWRSISYGIGYGYNANGHLASHAYPGSVTVAYAPNALGQPTQAGTWATNVGYHPNGAIKQFTYGSGVVHTMTQNSRGLPERIREAYSGATNPIVPVDESYDYDGNGNVAAISEGRTGQRGNRDMIYDGLDRLTRVDSPMFGTALYTYDVLDNLRRVKVGLTTAMRPARDHTYEYDAQNRLSRIVNTAGGAAVTSLGYDLQGNITSRTGASYSFDFGNRLRSANQGGTVSTYAYDGHGRRAWDTVGGTKHSQYNRDGVLMFARSTRGLNANRQYIHLGGHLIAIRTQDRDTGAVSTQYQHTDALGSVVARSSHSRASVIYSEYEPYGALSNRANHDQPAYTGHVQDTATGLTYMQQRYYDPVIGRFLSVDPITANANTGAGFNRYSYVLNNPYKFIDPDGRCEKVTGSRICSGGAGSNVSVIQVNRGNTKERAAMAQQYIDAVGPSVEREVRDSPKDSADLFSEVFQNPSTSLGLEFGARIVPSEVSFEGWQIREISFSTNFSPITGIGYNVRIRSIGGGYDVHTHPEMADMSKWFHPFSSSDVDIVNRFRLRSFVSQPDNSLYMLSDGGHPEKIR